MRQRKREGLADRKSQAAGNRLRNVVALAQQNDDEGGKGGGRKRRGGRKENAVDETDTFGADDADWLAYREISREGAGSEEEELDQTRLARIEEQLEKHDASFFTVLAGEMAEATSVWDRLRYGAQVATEGIQMDAQRMAQLHVNVERIRVPEALYQPSLMGVDQCGLGELVDELLRRFDAETQALLVANVFVTGGFARTRGFGERLEQELLQMRPAGSSFVVRFAQDMHLDAWRGAAKVACESETRWISSKWYAEHGVDRLGEMGLFGNPQ